MQNRIKSRAKEEEEEEAGWKKGAMHLPFVFVHLDLVSFFFSLSVRVARVCGISGETDTTRVGEGGEGRGKPRDSGLGDGRWRIPPPFPPPPPLPPPQNTVTSLNFLLPPPSPIAVLGCSVAVARLSLSFFCCVRWPRVDMLVSRGSSCSLLVDFFLLYYFFFYSGRVLRDFFLCIYFPAHQKQSELQRPISFAREHHTTPCLLSHIPFAHSFFSQLENHPCPRANVNHNQRNPTPPHPSKKLQQPRIVRAWHGCHRNIFLS